MSITAIRGQQILNGSVQRADMNTTTAGQAVITKIVGGTGIGLSSTGMDSGTGDVTVSAPVSANTGNLLTTGSDSFPFLSPGALDPEIWNVRLRSFNAIGNPTMGEVDQRQAGGSSVPSGNFMADRWQFYNAAATMKITGSPGTFADIPGTSFRITNKILGTSVTTVQTTAAAGDYAAIVQTIEGPMLRELIDDKFSLSILARSTLAGLKFGVVIRDSGNVRALSLLCTISSASTWQVFTFPGLPIWDPGGTFNLTPGSVGCTLAISYGGGTTYTSPANGTWQTGNFLIANGQDWIGAKALNTSLDIGFVQLEPGSQCTQLIDCPFGMNYDGPMGATRYYCKSLAYGTKPGTSALVGRLSAKSANAAYPLATARFPKEMAKAPTITLYSGDGTINNVDNFTAGTKISATPINISSSGFEGLNTASGYTANQDCLFHYTADTGW